ncbi:MAG: metal-dependent transcriptional regulator [Ignavibacteria bacterium]|nr:metal-dependent transcriptional regulator [Ignavibacteria bacterium]
MTSESIENYLGAMYRLQNEAGEVKLNQLADALNISGPAVTDMLKRLGQKDLVVYSPYKPVKFTSLGEQKAMQVIRRHRIWEKFLFEVVKFPWEKVHEEAERLEHSSSDELINYMEAMLDFPELDPHGNPIPSINGVLPRQNAMIKLADMNLLHSGIISRVNEHSQEFLMYLMAEGITLGKELRLIERRNFDNTLTITIDNQEKQISSMTAENIFMSNISNGGRDGKITE